MDLRFKHPFTCFVSGPTKAGKTTFVKSLIENANTFIDPPPSKIWWFYAEEQNFYKDLKDNVMFIKGPPDFNMVRENVLNEPQLVIIDDLMCESNNDVIFTRGCHHWNISVINIVQNIFYKGLRTSRINTEYLILMKNPSDRLQVQILARQLYPHKPKHLIEAYIDATKKPHSYLLIDLTQSIPDNLRLRADIFSKNVIVYTEKL